MAANDVYLYTGATNPYNVLLGNGTLPAVAHQPSGTFGKKTKNGRTKRNVDWVIEEEWPPKMAKPIKPLEKAAAALGIPKSTIAVLDEDDDEELMIWAHNEH